LAQKARARAVRALLADSTRRLLGNLFELKDLGTRDLKGIAIPVRASAPLRASSVEGRFDALHATGLTAAVGREEESEWLNRRWKFERAKGLAAKRCMLNAIFHFIEMTGIPSAYGLAVHVDYKRSRADVAVDKSFSVSAGLAGGVS
jgi:hypothetical protein